MISGQFFSSGLQAVGPAREAGRLMVRDTIGNSRRRLLIGVAIFLAMIVAGGAYEVFRAPDQVRLNPAQRFLVAGIVQKWEGRINFLPEGSRVVVGYGHLLGRLNWVEQSLVARIFAIDPKELGFSGPFQSTRVPENLVRVEPATYQYGGVQKNTGVQYCPRPVYEDYLKMMAAMRRDLGKSLLIGNAYRSPGRQAYGFFLYLARNHDYSLRENARWNAMPGYSEHNAPVNTAMDFINEAGIDGDSQGQTASDFEALPEYQWLLDHAAQYNFHLSYPRNNHLGVTFEPWHWHWQQPGN